MNDIVKYFTAALVTLFAILSFHAFWVNFKSGWHNSFAEFLPWFIAVLVVSIIYYFLLTKAKEDQRIYYIALGFILFTLLLRFIWISYFDAQQVSDFRTYWNIGSSILNQGLAEVNAGNTYLRRALFYTVPVQYLFGNSLKALEIVNVFLVSIAMLIYFEFGRRAFDAKVAALSLLFFFWNPDIWYGVKLASHDIAFLPWFAGLCLLMYWLDEKISQANLVSLSTFVLSFSAGIFVLIIDIQRGWGRPVWFAFLFLLFYYIYESYTSGEREVKIRNYSFVGLQMRLLISIACILFILIIPFTANQASSTLLDSFTKTEDRSGLGVNITNVSMTYYAAKDVLGSDRWSERKVWRRTYSALVPEQILNKYSLKKLTHEFFSDPSETIRHFFRKNAVLSNPGGTLSFSSRPAEDPWVGRTNTSNVSMQRSLHSLLTAILFFALFLRLLLYPYFTVKRGQLFLIIYTAFFYLFIILLTEVQPRYNVFTVFLISLLVAQLLLMDFRKTEKK